MRRRDMPEYFAYHSARQRCINSKHSCFHHYGGRGIEFKFNSFEEFFQYLGYRPEGMELDRIDNDGHYEKENVRWATRSTQIKNRRPMSVETCKKLSQKLMGRTFSIATIRKMSISAKRAAKKRICIPDKQAKGYCWDPARNRYAAYISINRKRKSLGRFKTEAEARIARDAAIKEYEQ